MSKSVKITPEISKWIRASVGDQNFDTSKVTVFETRLLSTEALHQAGFWNGARISASTLKEMEGHLSADGNAVPLLIMHEKQMLPVGRLFKGKLMDMPNGEIELRGLFYIPNNRTTLIDDIEMSVTDEVSVGVKFKAALCSECGFDYFGKDASILNLMTMTCTEGHTIGEDGVHVRGVGLEVFAELSLVNRGAAKKAKILPRASQSLSQETVERLAASGIPADATFLTASSKMDGEISQPSLTNQGEFTMDLKEILASLEAKTSELATLKVELETSKKTAATEIDSLKAQLQAATEEVASLKAAAGQTDTELTAKVAKAENDLKAAAEKLMPHVKAALTAAGVAENDIPTDLTAAVALIEEKGLKLHQIVGSEPVTNGGKSDVKSLDANDKRFKEAFKNLG